MKVGIIERVLDLLFEYQEIRQGCEATLDPAAPVYLKRWFLAKNTDPDRAAGLYHQPRWNLTMHKTDGRQLYLHKIMRSDLDRELHDHPWDFVSLILWRGYREETEDFVRVEMSPKGRRFSRKLPGMVLRRSAEHRHRVHIGNWPAWTLVLTSHKKRNWFFWRDGLAIPWRGFVSRKCEEASR